MFEKIFRKIRAPVYHNRRNGQVSISLPKKLLKFNPNCKKIDVYFKEGKKKWLQTQPKHF